MGAIAFGLVAAFAWGVHDILVRYISQKSDLMIALFAVLVFGVLAQVPLTIGFGDFTNLTSTSLLYSSLAGVAFTFACIGHYNAFKRGPVRLVAPLIGCYSVLAFVIAALTGAEVTIIQWAMLGLLVAGIALIARSSEGENEGPAECNMTGTLVYCVMAIFGFALTFALGHNASSGADVWASGVITRLVTVGLIGLLLFATFVIGKKQFVMPNGKTMLILALMGVLDAVALGVVLAAGVFDRPEFASASSSIFGLVTVILAWMFMKEPIAKIQWLGIASVFLAIAYLASV